MIGVRVNIAYLLSVLVYPYMPNVSNTIRRQLNVEEFQLAFDRAQAGYDSENIKPSSYSFPKLVTKFNCFLKPGHKIGKSEPLFKRIAETDAKVWKEKFAGQQKKEELAAAAAAEEAKKQKKLAEKEAKKAKKAAQQAAAAPDAAPSS